MLYLSIGLDLVVTLFDAPGLRYQGDIVTFQVDQHMVLSQFLLIIE